MLASARHVMLPFFLSKCHILQTMILNNTFFFPPSIKESLNGNLYLGIGSFQRFSFNTSSPLYNWAYMMKSSNFGVGSTRKPPPWPVEPPERFRTRWLRPKGEVTPPAKVGSKTMGNTKQRNTGTVFFEALELKDFYRLSRSFLDIEVIGSDWKWCVFVSFTPISSCLI